MRNLFVAGLLLVSVRVAAQPSLTDSQYTIVIRRRHRWSPTNGRLRSKMCAKAKADT